MTKFKVKLPQDFFPLLWEYDVSGINAVEFPAVIIERALQFGNIKQLRWIFKYFGYPAILKYFTSRGWRILSDMDYNFWLNILRSFQKNNIDWKKINQLRSLHKRKNKSWKF